MAYIRRNEEAQILASNWVRWIRTRKYLAPALPPNILSVLMGGSGSGKEPDGPMSPDMPYFNKALTIMIHDKEAAPLLVPFLIVYCDADQTPIKRVASDAGRSRKQYTSIANKGAHEVMRFFHLAKSVTF